MLGLYTSTPGAASGPRLPREPEELLVELLPDGVVVAVEDRLPLLGAPTRHYVHCGGFDLRQVSLGACRTVEVLFEALSVRQASRRSNHLAAVALLQVPGELVQHHRRRRRDVGDAQTLYLPHRTRPKDRRDHGEVGFDPAHPFHDTADLLLAGHRLLAHRQDEEVGDY